jgi:hypothetical protein
MSLISGFTANDNLMPISDTGLSSYWVDGKETWMADIKGAALVVVPADWKTNEPIGLSEEAHKRWMQVMDTAQRVLIYKSSPVDAVVAEGEVIDKLNIRLDEWPKANMKEKVLTATGTPAAYAVPLRILYTRAAEKLIPLERVREWVDDPQFPNAEWLPLTPDAYAELTNWP